MGICCLTQGAQPGALCRPRGVGCGWWEDAQKAGNMADSHYYTAETNTTLQSNYPSVQKKKKKIKH